MGSCQPLHSLSARLELWLISRRPSRNPARILLRIFGARVHQRRADELLVNNLGNAHFLSFLLMLLYRLSSFISWPLLRYILRAFVTNREDALSNFCCMHRASAA